jgi:hypothetical protein
MVSTAHRLHLALNNWPGCIAQKCGKRVKPPIDGGLTRKNRTLGEE